MFCAVLRRKGGVTETKTSKRLTDLPSFTLLIPHSTGPVVPSSFRIPSPFTYDLRFTESNLSSMDTRDGPIKVYLLN